MIAKPDAGAGMLTRYPDQQLLQAKIAMPAVTFFYAAVTLVAWTQPVWFIAGNAHLIFAVMQLLAAGMYLYYVVRYFTNITPQILAHRQEHQQITAMGTK